MLKKTAVILSAAKDLLAGPNRRTSKKIRRCAQDDRVLKLDQGCYERISGILSSPDVAVRRTLQRSDGERGNCPDRGVVGIAFRNNGAIIDSP
jgi:hypothetical protein